MIYRFRSCRLDTRRYRVEVDGQPVAVEPKVFDLLLLLIENRDRVVSRDEILDTVWQGRLVSDAALSGCVKAARRAIGDDGARQDLIRTHRGRGFSFVGEVVEEPGTTARAGASAGHLPKTGKSDADDLLSGIDLSLPRQPSIVVLPFRYLGSEDRHIVADGLTLDVTTRLARLRWLFVIARGTAFSFQLAGTDPLVSARQLGVRYVLHGSAQVSGAKIRVHTALSDALSGREIWAEDFDRGTGDFLNLQDEISMIVTGAVEHEIERTERQRALGYRVENLDAWSAYHRGCSHMFRSNESDFDLAEQYLRRSLSLEPSAPRPYAALSFIHWQRAFLEISDDPDRSRKEALDCAQQSIDLDPLDPQGHWALGRVYLLQRDYDSSMVELKQSVELNPSFAMGHYSLGLNCGLSCRFSESHDHVSRARRLSPYDPMSYAMLAQQAVNLLMQGKIDEAAATADRAARQPNAHLHISFIAAYCNAAAGRIAMGKQHIAALLARKPDYRAADYFRVLPVPSAELTKHIVGGMKKLGFSV